MPQPKPWLPSWRRRRAEQQVRTRGVWLPVNTRRQWVLLSAALAAAQIEPWLTTAHPVLLACALVAEVKAAAEAKAAAAKASNATGGGGEATALVPASGADVAGAGWGSAGRLMADG